MQTRTPELMDKFTTYTLGADFNALVHRYLEAPGDVRDYSTDEAAATEAVLAMLKKGDDVIVRPFTAAYGGVKYQAEMWNTFRSKKVDKRYLKAATKGSTVVSSLCHLFAKFVAKGLRPFVAKGLRPL